MNLSATESGTGKVLMTHFGSLSPDAFKKTVLAAFPRLQPDDVEVSSTPSPATKSASASSNGLIWKGPFYDLGGYAGMNREIVLRLIHHGFNVRIDPLRTPSQVDSMTDLVLKGMESTRVNDDCPIVLGSVPTPMSARGRRVAFYTMMETQGVHPEFVARCNKEATEVWVPCGFYKKAFEDGGVKVPVHVLPLGVNHKLYHPEAKDPALEYEEMPSGKKAIGLPAGFRFMSVFGWSHRKGPDVLCRSFLREFDSLDDALLVIFSRHWGSSSEESKEHVRSEIRRYYKEIGKSNPPPIYYCGDEVPAADLPGCYAAAQAFVFCSRGEGFGLPVVEAGACGVPIISTFNSAMTEYLDDTTALLVRSDAVELADERLSSISEFYRGQMFPSLGDDAVEQFSRLMRLTYSHADKSRPEALRARILEKYTWDACADRVAERLRAR